MLNPAILRDVTRLRISNNNLAVSHFRHQFGQVPRIFIYAAESLVKFSFG